MSNNKAKPFFLAQNEGFGNAEAKDELLHPERNRLVTADSQHRPHTDRPEPVEGHW